MEGFRAVLKISSVSGIIILSFILFVSGILRWLSPFDRDEKIRRERLNILSWIATAGLCAASLLYFTWGPGGNDKMKTRIFLNASGKLFAFLFLGIIAISAVVLIVIIAIYLYLILQVMVYAGKQLNREANKKLEKYVEALRSPTVAVAIASGIMSLFLIFPFLVGMSEPETNVQVAQNMNVTKENEDNEQHVAEEADELAENDGLLGIWGKGVNRISSFFVIEKSGTEEPGTKESGTEEPKTEGSENNNEKNDNDNSANAFVTYALVYIVALGGVLAVIRILHSIIRRTFEEKEEKDKDLIGEYSNPMGLLAVGVAALWMMRKKGVNWNDEVSIIENLLKSFGTVLLITTLVILVLEVIRLLLDMKEPFIRRSARFLFVVMVGECALMLMNIVYTFFSALGNAIGSENNMELYEFHDDVMKNMDKLMKKQLKVKKKKRNRGKKSSKKKQNNNPKQIRIFKMFKKKVTKK